MTDRQLSDLPRLIMLEDVTESQRPDTGASEPVRTLRDRHGNQFVLLSVAQYLRLLSSRGRP